MRIGRVIGSVVLSRWHESLAGASYRVAVPLSLADLRGDRLGAAEPIVVYDEWGAGEGGLIAISEGGEAAQPFYPLDKPIDAYNAALLDNVEISEDEAWTG